ncbi:MAG: hypothetical protein M1834_002955 [Cirrosporium novae-zelandiae]|nr:MAG: hypothetical protein M1834_002955 [Cirrosporium novae-zelandiae]
MAPISATQTLLSPAELSYLHSSLSLHPPVRPDGRSSTQFRPLIAETDVLPSTNGSTRVCFADGTEAVVGIKLEVEKSFGVTSAVGVYSGAGSGGGEGDEEDAGNGSGENKSGKGRDRWVEVSIEIPGFRDDDSVPVFLAQMLREAVLADGGLVNRLIINSRWNWRIYIDILLLSPALSYPLPLLSLTTYLALRTTRVPRLKSEGDEDPLFDDDWEAAEDLYPPTSRPQQWRNGDNDEEMQDVTDGKKMVHGWTVNPPITLLVMSVGDNIIFDPTREELAVADAVLAVSVSVLSTPTTSTSTIQGKTSREFSILALRTVDLPGRLTNPGIPNSMNTATGGVAPKSEEEGVLMREMMATEKGVWRPPRGGMNREVLKKMVGLVVEKGGVAEEVLEGLEGLEGVRI